MMTNLDSEKLRGRVRTICTELAEWDSAEKNWQPPKRRTMFHLRPDGNIDEHEERHPHGVSRILHSYDEAGRVLESTFQLNDGPIHKSVFRYDELGRLTKKVELDQNGSKRESEICLYDASGRKTKRQFPEPPGNTVACGISYGVEGAEKGYGAQGVVSITTLYDDQDRPYEASFHDENRAVVLRVLLTRDDQGRLVKEEGQSAEDSTLSQILGVEKAAITTTYVYDERGRQVERRTSMYGMSEERTTRQFDENDNPIREVEETESSDMQGDDAGNLQPVNVRSSRHEIRFDYKYDSCGNWIERIVSMKFQSDPEFRPSNVVRREISYY